MRSGRGIDLKTDRSGKPEEIHIFLTGVVGAGKSTVLNKALALKGMRYGGFKTYFGADRVRPDKKLYINDAALPPSFSDDNIAAHFREGRPPEPVPEAFNRLGTGFLRNARENAQIIVMDECGNIEKEAAVFRKEIMDILDGDKPVLGVLKLRAAGWADDIRNHRKVRIITVSEANRDSLPELIARLIVPNITDRPI